MHAMSTPTNCGRLAVLLVALVPFSPTLAQEEAAQLFRLRSTLLSEFWGRDIYLEAGVVVPPADVARGDIPVCYDVHGFGGSHRVAWKQGARLTEKMRAGYPRMLYVFLNGSCPQGHHEFADSVNNGPWGRALVTELIPVLEKQFAAGGRPERRFVTGHSSGGWSSLWLQVNYPDVFGGVWSLAPDSIDFRDFSGVDVYRQPNIFFDADGKEIPLVRKGKEWAETFKQYCDGEFAAKSYGGQFASFNAVFSPRGDDGTPLPLFDPKTGKIDSQVAKAWERYDIGLILRSRWSELGPRLRGKLHVICGLDDTYRLEGACKLLRADLEKLESDAEVILVEGRDHGSVFAPHELWPDGLMAKVHGEMLRRCGRRARI